MVRLVDESHFGHCLWTQNGTVEMRKRFDDVYLVKTIADFRDLLRFCCISVLTSLFTEFFS